VNRAVREGWQSGEGRRTAIRDTVETTLLSPKVKSPRSIGVLARAALAMDKQNLDAAKLDAQVMRADGR
jgi:hypothetical protein